MATQEALAMMRWFAVYWETFPEHERVDIDSLKWLITQRSQGQPPEQVALVQRYADLLKQPFDEASIKGAIGTLYDLDFVGQAGAILAAYDRGDDIDPVHSLEELARRVKRAKANGKADDFERTPISQILAEVGNNQGIHFDNLPCLRDGLQGLQGGASIAICARPDKGKTSLIAAFLAAFAPQCVRYFGAHRPILWLNNEGTAKRILPRIYQAALRATLDEIVEYSNTGRLEAMYKQALGIPNLEYIRVKDIHGANLAQIEQIIEDMNPCVVVYDMLANVRMHVQQNGNKADAVEAAWQTVREMAVLYDHIAMSTVQVSVDGDNQLYPQYSALKDSRTGVQGATDIILMLGALNDARLQDIRGISTPKNKFARSGKPSHIQQQLTFDGARCAFMESTSASTNEGIPLPRVQA
jgi:hypothetical protein